MQELRTPKLPIVESALLNLNNMDNDEIEDKKDDWRRHKPYSNALKRKKINFVAAGSSTSSSATTAPRDSPNDIASQYLALVLPKHKLDAITNAPNKRTTSKVEVEEEGGGGGEEEEEKEDKLSVVTSPNHPQKTHQKLLLLSSKSSDDSLLPPPPLSPPICEICKLPITDSLEKHMKTLAHQSALPHSFPPHHYDRSSKGLKYLMEQGWDPDKRVGLGAEEQGERFPLKPDPKYDTLGLGVKKKRNSSAPIVGVVVGRKWTDVETNTDTDTVGDLKEKKKKKLNAKQASLEAEREKERRKMLQEYLFGK